MCLLTPESHVTRGMSRNYDLLSQQYLSCALVRGRGIVFCHNYQSIASIVGKDFRDGAVVPFECMWMLLVY